MKTPDRPADEALRLETLRALDILDTEPEERFDRLTRMARRLFDVPIALLSLVDENRQWFKSCIGLALRETPRDVAFSGHAILGDEVFLIRDATQDERFADNPLVTQEPFVRFYAGCPLRAPNGQKLGTLCVIDRQPRTLDRQDLEVLRDLAAMAEREIAALQLATLDDLTAITNRHGFQLLARHSLRLHARQGDPAALVFVDLDGFQQINDTYGHAEGDRALIAFAQLMRDTLRSADLFARIGGDEFVILLTDSTEQNAEHVMRRFQEAVAAHNREAARGYDIRFSHGVVAFDPDQYSAVEALLEQGDAMMKQIKRTNGRA